METMNPFTGGKTQKRILWEREIFNSLTLIKASPGICFRPNSHESTTGKSIGSQAELAFLHIQLLSLAGCENFTPLKD